MSGFNPDAYLAEKTKGFDPDAYLSQKAPKMSAGKAALTGAEDAATFGLRGFLAGVGGGIGQGAGALYGGAGLSDALKSAKTGFVEAREEAKAEKAKAMEDQPLASIAGGLGGAVLTAPLTAARGLKGALAAGAATGAGTAASEAESGKEALGMIGGGAALGAAGYGAGKALSAGAKGVKNAAARLAYRALGPNAGDARRSLAKGQVEKIGSQLLKDKVIGWLPKSYSSIGDAVEARAKIVGQALGATKDQLDDIAKREGLTAVDPLKVAKAAYEGVRVDPKLPGAQRMNRRFGAWTKEFFAKNGNLSSLKDAEALKTAINDTINWNRLPDADIPAAEQFARSLSKALRGQAEEGAERVAGFGGKELVGKFKGEKAAYGALKQAEDIVGRKEARTLANNLLSPSDKAATGLGAAIGFMSSDDPETRLKNAALGAGLGAANKFMRTGGVQLGAKGLYSLSNLLKLAPRASEPLSRSAILNLIRSEEGTK